MRTHFTHRFDAKSQLVMEEHNSEFHISYLTLEPTFNEEGEPPQDSWYSNHGQVFTDYNQALHCFRKRRDSDNPFVAFELN